MNGNNDTKSIVFNKGTPIGFTYYQASQIYAIKQENSHVYITYTNQVWYIGCYTKLQYSNDTTIGIMVFYI